jgi:hypothetical protein
MTAIHHIILSVDRKLRFLLTLFLASTYTPGAQLPKEWNSGFGSLSFVYSHKQSAMKFVVRIDRMGAKVEVRGLAIGDENIYRFEKLTRDVVNSSKLPVRINVTPEGEDRGGLADKLREVFISEAAVEGQLPSTLVTSSVSLHLLTLWLRPPS